MGSFAKEVNDNNFESEVLKSTMPTLVDFWAPWCGPCVALGPIIESLAEEYQGKVNIVKMNVDENANTPSEYGVRSIPFLVLIKNGKVLDSIVGAQPKPKLKELLDKSLI
ncbi:MAG: thioredoxin [Oligoflexales bacterium]|nr:thioredoxin [Oligoflexales bacterium]